MAKIKVAGGAAALVSTLTLEELRLLEKYRPKALVLKEGDEEVFRVSTCTEGSVTENGVCFAAATRDEAALAEVTLMIPAGVKDAKEFAVDAVGPAVLMLGKVEARAKTALEELKAELTQVRESVSIA